MLRMLSLGSKSSGLLLFLQVCLAASFLNEPEAFSCLSDVGHPSVYHAQREAGYGEKKKPAHTPPGERAGVCAGKIVPDT